MARTISYSRDFTPEPGGQTRKPIHRFVLTSKEGLIRSFPTLEIALTHIRLLRYTDPTLEIADSQAGNGNPAIYNVKGEPIAHTLMGPSPLSSRNITPVDMVEDPALLDDDDDYGDLQIEGDD